MPQSKYRKVDEKILDKLVRIVGEKNVITGEGMKDFSRDETPNVRPAMPEVVVKPDSAEAVSRILKLAGENSIAVTPRGAGTGLSGGCIPLYGGIVLALEKMDKILEIDMVNFTGTAEAGVTLERFSKAVAEKGMYYPPYPGEKLASIGGNVATNAGGMRAVRYGVTRNFVLGLEAVLPTGEIIRTGGKFFKNSTGYDLSQLIAGSEGTLAVITSVTLKVINPAGSTEVLFVPFNSLAEAIGTVPEILRKGIFPIGLEFMQKNIIDLVEKYTGKEIPHHEHDSFLLIILEAESDEEIVRQAEKIGEICLERGAVDVFLGGNEAARRNLLEAREKFYMATQQKGMLQLSDVVVPRSLIAEFVEKADVLVRRAGLELIAIGHAGDGNLHLHLMGERTRANEEMAEQMMVELYRLGVSMGGTISGEHGIGFEKMGYLPLAIEPARMALMKRIKHAFDPQGILNPGKLFGEG